MIARHLVVALALFCALPLHAAPPPTRIELRARTLFLAGRAQYEKGAYEQALQKFREAMDLAPNPAFLFNMAACEEQLAHLAKAAELLREYLRQKPDDFDRAQIEERIATLEAMDQVGKPPPAPPPVVPASTPEPVVTVPPAPPPPPRRVISWALLGVTLATGAAAAGIGTWALLEHDELAATCGAHGAPGCSHAQLDGLAQKELATYVLIGIASAAAISTIVMFIVEPRLARRSVATARLIPGGLRF